MRAFVLSCCLILSLTSCKPLIATYDQYSYTQNASIKVDLFNIIQKANESYTDHEKEINEVLLKVKKIKEYDVHKPRNEIMAKMWNILWNRLTSTKTEGAISQHPIGFFPFWKQKEKLNEDFVTDASSQINEMYDCRLPKISGYLL
ncbi:MAG: hypothetical protein J0I09_12765 [Sphingobacteriia bacterium]|nr:hypothetical protein [Sphingobacteriia bacterium]